ncbi:hypothetical protein HDU81_002371 [Chytriomyces hyalinus]|nr:hypothetical protein HDU81_002371 [Chytriomyces hyalinus]
MIFDTPDAYENLILACHAIAGVTSLQICVLIYFIVFIERRTSQPFRLKNYWTPFNWLLFIMVTTMLIQTVFEIYCIRAAQQQEVAVFEVIRAMQVAFLSVCESSYIIYTWLRSRDIVDQMVPQWTTFGKYFVATHVTLTIMQFIPKLVAFLVPSVLDAMTLFAGIFPIALALTTVIFDSSMLVLFVMYLNSSRGVAPVTAGTLKSRIHSLTAKDSGPATPVARTSTATASLPRKSQREVDPRLAIVARHGIVSIVAGFVIVGLMIVWILTYERYLVAVFVFMDVIFCCLFAMKVALWRQKQESLAQLKGRV